MTPDHVNPERPWPEVEDLRRWTAESGLALTERLTAHPRYVLGALERDEAWIDPRLHPHVRALVDPATGLAREDARAVGLVWQEPDGGMAATGSGTGRVDLHRGVDEEGRSADRRSDFDEVYGDWQEVAARRRRAGRASASTPTSGPALGRAQDDPAGLSDDDYLALLTADGADLDAVAALADELRRDVVGDDVTYVVNRNINFTNVCYVGLPVLRVRPAQDRRRRLHALAGRGRPAGRRGAGARAPPRSACRAGSTRT